MSHVLPSYKKIHKIAVACCRMAECDKFVEGICTASTKEECAIERGIEELSRYTHSFKNAFGKNSKMSAYEYVTKYRYNCITFKPYKNPVCVRVIFETLCSCRKALEIEKQKEEFWKEHEKERVWEKSYRELKELGKYGYWLHEDTCYRCKHQFDGKCLKYSDERTCYAEEFCKEWGTELSKEGHRLACSLEEDARYKRLRSIDDSTIEGFYATSALRGGWCGD